jgi:hypothetical protein
MTNKDINPTSILAVLLLSAMAFLLSAMPVSAKVALGSSGFSSSIELENGASNALTLLEKSLSYRLAVLGNSNVPVDNLPKKEVHSDLNIGQNNSSFNPAAHTKINLKQEAVNVRAGLPSGPRTGGNVAVADIQIEGLKTTKLSAHSSIDKVRPKHKSDSLVGKGSGNFEATKVINKAGDERVAVNDSEFKILDNLADKLGSNKTATGKVTIFTERKACDSCLGVAKQFKEKHPNIELNIVDNKNRVILPNADLIKETRGGK